MKKLSFVSILILLICVLGLAGCGKSEAEKKQEQAALAQALAEANAKAEAEAEAQTKAAYAKAMAEIAQARAEAEQAWTKENAQANAAEAQAAAGEEIRAQASVRSYLKDPDSAKFGKMIVIDSESACIPVNARNSFGGYIGEKYVALKKSQENGGWVYDNKFTSDNSDFVDSLCRMRIQKAQ